MYIWGIWAKIVLKSYFLLKHQVPVASKIQNQEILIEFFFTENLYFIVCFNVIRKIISLFVIRKCRQFAPGSVVSVVYQPLPVLSLLGRIVSNPWLSEKGRSCWGNERWSPNLAWGEKNGPTFCHRVSLGDSIEWSYVISVAGLLKFIEKVNKNTVTDSGQCLTSLWWHSILDIYWSAV